jgi:anti-sigma factor RsiW
VVSVQHAAEDDLESYAMRTLPAPKVESLEEHLLVCAGCRYRLTAADEYVAAMRAAAAKIRKDEAPPHRPTQK